MSIFDVARYLLFGPGSTKSNPTYLANTQYANVAAPSRMPRNMPGYMDEGYKNKIVFRVVGQIARSGAGIKWKHYTDKTKKTEIENSQLLQLWDSPNSEEGGASFREAMLSYYCITGNTYVVGLNAADNPKGKFDELWTIRPDLTKVHMTPFGPDYYEYGNQSPPKKYAKAQVMHTKHFAALDDVYGMSPVEVAAFLVDIQKAGQKWNLGLMANMARPGGAWTTDNVLNDNDYKSLKREIREKFAGPRNAGETVILHGGVKWQSLVGLTPVELDWIESDTKTDKDIAGIFFNFPVYLLGLADSTFTNLSEAKHYLYTDIVFPIWDKFVYDINRWLTPRYGGWLDYDREDVETIQDRLQDAQNTLSDRATQEWAAGALMWNDLQEMLGRPRIPGADVVLINNQIFSPKDFADIAAQNADKLINPPPPPMPMLPPGHTSVTEVPNETTPPAKALHTPLYITKALNLSSAQAKSSYFDAMEAARDPWITEIESRLQDYFKNEQKTVQHALSLAIDAETANARIQHALLVLQQQGTLKQLLVSLYQDVGSAIGSDVLQQIIEGLNKKYGRRYNRKDDTGQPNGSFTASFSNLFSPDVLVYLLSVAGTKAKDIYGSELADLQSAIAEGVQQGESIPELAKRIDDLYIQQIIPDRSTVIARTEVIAASNYGSQQAAYQAQKQTNTKLNKVWLATNDDRTREAHRVADGQTVALDDAFSVDGEKLMYPGDPSGSAGNVINCRCTEYYEDAPGQEENEDDMLDDDTENLLNSLGIERASRALALPSRDAYRAALKKGRT